MTNWRSDIQKWDKLTKESAQLFIAQAESRLKATEETAAVVTNSNDRLLGIITSLFTVSIGYIFAGDQIYLQSVALFTLLFCSIPGYYLIRNLSAYKIYTLGEEPKAIFISEMIDNNLTEKQQYLNLVFHMMETIQLKLDQNYETNSLRQKRLTKAKIALLFTPFSFLLGLVYMYLFGYHLEWIL